MQDNRSPLIFKSSPILSMEITILHLNLIMIQRYHDRKYSIFSIKIHNRIMTGHHDSIIVKLDI